MYLEYHLASESLFMKSFMYIYHCEFYYICCTPLHGCVYCYPFTKLPGTIFAARKFRYITSPVKKCSYNPRLQGAAKSLFYICLYPCMSCKIVVYVFLCLMLGYADVRCKSIGAHTVYNPEVYSLCPPSLNDSINNSSPDICASIRNST